MALQSPMAATEAHGSMTYALKNSGYCLFYSCSEGVDDFFVFYTAPKSSDLPSTEMVVDLRAPHMH
jgi:hypothetical protein